MAWRRIDGEGGGKGEMGEEGGMGRSGRAVARCGAEEKVLRPRRLGNEPDARILLPELWCVNLIGTGEDGHT